MKSYLIRLAPHLGTIVTVILILLGYEAWRDNVSAAPSTQSGSPGIISYQGTLTNAAGQPVSGNTDIIFRLYNAPTGGGVLWTENHTGANAVPIENGLFHVSLGSLTPIPSSVWNNPTVYLGMQIGSNPEMSPRELLGAVPMAMSLPRHTINGAMLNTTGFGAAGNRPLRNFVIRGPVSQADLTTTSETPPSGTTLDLRNVVGSSAEMVILQVLITDDTEGSVFQAWPNGETAHTSLLNAPIVRTHNANQRNVEIIFVRCDSSQTIKYSIDAKSTDNMLEELNVTVIGWVESATTP